MKQSVLTKKFFSDIESKKAVIAEFYIREFGEKYRKKILERLDNIIIGFRGNDSDFVVAHENVSKEVIAPPVNLSQEKEAELNEEFEICVRNKAIIERNKAKQEAINKDFFYAFSAYCLDKGIGELSAIEEKMLLDTLDVEPFYTKKRLSLLMDFCFTKALGKKIYSKNDLVSVLQIDNSERSRVLRSTIILGPQYGGKSLFVDAFNRLMQSNIETCNYLEEVMKNSLITQDSAALFIPYLGEFRDLILGVLVKRQENLEVPVVFRDGELRRFIVYNADNLWDNVILHEIDHAIVQSVKKGQEKGKYILTSGFSVGTFENGKKLEGQNDDYAYNLALRIHALEEGEAYIKDNYVVNKEGKEFVLIEQIAEEIEFFSEVCTDYRARKIAKQMKDAGIVLYNNDKTVNSGYMVAFAGCDNMFEQLMPLINKCQINEDVEGFIKTVGLVNYLKLIHNVYELKSVDMSKCAPDMAEVYYRYASGIYALGDREFTEEEQKYIKCTDAINSAIEQAVEDSSDDFFKHLWTP